MGRLIFDTLERDQSGFIPIVNDSSGDPATGPSSTSASAEIHGSIFRLWEEGLQLLPFIEPLALQPISPGGELFCVSSMASRPPEQSRQVTDDL